jgi:hypothetical protein
MDRGANVLRHIQKPNSPDGCWQWTASAFRGGYGHTILDRQEMAAHRAVWILLVGPIPEGLFVCHRCDNPGCVNPDHLFLGTHHDNMADRGAKRRQVRGEQHPRAKLTESAVAEMREAYARGGISQASLARRYGVAHSLIHRVLHNESWKS